VRLLIPVSADRFGGRSDSQESAVDATAAISMSPVPTPTSTPAPTPKAAPQRTQSYESDACVSWFRNNAAFNNGTGKIRDCSMIVF